MNFKQLPNGMSEGFALLKKCDVKKTKNGAAYLDLVLGDKSDELPAKLWDYTDNGLFANAPRRMLVFTDVFEKNEETSYELLKRAQDWRDRVPGRHSRRAPEVPFAAQKAVFFHNRRG